MQAVILAAGKGERMNHLTKILPKPLISVAGKTLLEWKLEFLPPEIYEVIIVVGHKKDLIKKRFGNRFKNKSIVYTEDKTLTGTAHALWQTKDHLKDRFLVMMGDDIYSEESFISATKESWAIVCKKANRNEDGGRVILNKQGNLVDFITAGNYRKKFADGGLIFTGLYSLNKDIFKYEPIKMKTKEEWGLPHTLAAAASEQDVKIIEADFWISINTPEDLKIAEPILRDSY